MKKHDESTGHKQEPSGDANVVGNPEGAMPMGMTGTTSDGDPDQKSTKVAPNTVESTLPDGSPKFADPGASAQKSAAKAGKYEAVTRFTTSVDGSSKTVEPGEIVDLEAAEAESLGDAVKPAGK
jgi:hypothetical protein